MMQILAVVPPMSNDRMRLIPMFSAIQVDRITPPAGPDSTRRIGKRAAVSKVVRPPPEVISRIGQLKPDAMRRVLRLSR